MGGGPCARTLEKCGCVYQRRRCSVWEELQSVWLTCTAARAASCAAQGRGSGNEPYPQRLVGRSTDRGAGGGRRLRCISNLCGNRLHRFAVRGRRLSGALVL